MSEQAVQLNKPDGQPGRVFPIKIDGEMFKFDDPIVTGRDVLARVGKKPCAFDLVAEFSPHRSESVAPDAQVDLRTHGLNGFVTSPKSVVDITINGTDYQMTRGEHSVSEILGKVGLTADAYMLLQEKDGPPLPLPGNVPVTLQGCEVFHTQVQTGGSSS